LSKTLFVLLLGSMIISACIPFSRNRTFDIPMMGDFGASLRDFQSNGEQIFYTDTNDSGQRISSTGGSNIGGMMGTTSELNCASCHGNDGSGGIHLMHMDVMDAPDIRFSALSAEDNGLSDEHEDEHTLEHKDYDLEAFRQAVIYGKHPDGTSLDQDMPRWQMDDDDLSDLFIFIKSLE
jgi:hypothetical protein